MIFFSIVLSLLWLGTPSNCVYPPFPIISLNGIQAYFRFQAPTAGQTTADARVTSLVWDQTVQQVTNTMNDYANINENNVQLWLSDWDFAFRYAGIIASPCGALFEPQRGLNRDNVAMSIIMPSGVQKLQTVMGDKSQMSRQVATACTGIIGLQGTLEPTDYAYASVSAVKEAYKMLSDPTTKKNGGHIPMYFDAVRGDGLQFVLSFTIAIPGPHLIKPPAPLP